MMMVFRKLVYSENINKALLHRLLGSFTKTVWRPYLNRIFSIGCSSVSSSSLTKTVCEMVHLGVGVFIGHLLLSLHLRERIGEGIGALKMGATFDQLLSP